MLRMWTVNAADLRVAHSAEGVQVKARIETAANDADAEWASVHL
jgi:hypothetical protein